jgi:hypothetical protein
LQTIELASEIGPPWIVLRHLHEYSVGKTILRTMMSAVQTFRQIRKALAMSARR